MSRFSARDAYLDRYGFTHDPFAARVPGFRFYAPQRKTVLAQLHHLARYSQLLLVVTGPRGSGKTLLRQALVASSNKDQVLSVVIVAGSQEESVLTQVILALGGDGHTVSAAGERIGQLAGEGQSVYLLVDDAQWLDDDDLEFLLQLAALQGTSRPQIFLFGDELLPGRLELLAGRDSYHVIELQPYTEDETRGYLAQRLEGAGSDLECFDEAQISQIQQCSGGWPGEINRCARDLLEGPARGPGLLAGGGLTGLADWWSGLRFSLPALPVRHLLGAGAVVIGILLTLLLTRKPSENPQEPVTRSLSLKGGAETVAAGPVIREPLAAAGGGEPEPEGDEANDGGRPASQGQTARQDLAPALPVVPVQAPVAAARAGAPAAGPVTRQAPARSRPDSTENRTPAARPASRPEPVVRAAPAPVAPAPAPVRPAARPAAVASSVHTGWYRRQPGSHYALQVMGTRSEQTARTLQAQGSAYRYYVKSYQGKPLYVVTYGSFASRDAALAAVRRLPASLQSGKPWARSFSSIQGELRQEH